MKMQKQKSFSLKSRKFLAFTLTLTLLISLLILSFLSFWVMQDTTFSSVQLETHLHLHKPSFDALNLELENTLYRKPQSSPRFVRVEYGMIENVSLDSDVLAGNDKLAKMADGYNGKLISSSDEAKVSSGQKKYKRDCDVSLGRWVFDENYPLYTNFSCPFIDEGFNCQGNGRLDSDYMKWRWQPQDCDIPRFNATQMLEMIRGKRLVFVGDSINRNQWESMLCLLMAAVKDPRKVYETHGRKITKEKGNYSFRFVDYKCTVEFHVSHYLVLESKARIGHKRVETLQIDRIDRGSSKWRNADILIFNTANWWTHSKTRAGINYYQEGNLVNPHLEVLTAFR